MNEDKFNNNWFDQLKKGDLFLIAGPCSAENPEQLLAIAKEIKDKAAIFRAGIWKPRTRPGSFEGVGAIGLDWLRLVKQETQLPIGVEVANAQHVELALKNDVDMLWIGARTSVNPFAVQEIADALKGTDHMVMVKNPINPDAALWMGGIERLLKADIHKIAAIHRGFSSYEATSYRNPPQWQIPIEIKTSFPELKMICDPSHITGNRDRIFEVAQTALDLDFDGLMIETHHNPGCAWSDAKQQITPAQLAEGLQELKVRDTSNTEENFQLAIKNKRQAIDDLDKQILSLLHRRMQWVEQIGQLKKEKNVAVFQKQRWQEVLDKMKKEAAQLQLSEDFIADLYQAIHQESIDRQTKIINTKQ